MANRNICFFLHMQRNKFVLELEIIEELVMSKKKEINQSGVFYTELKDKIVIEEAITHLQSAYTKKLQV